MKERISISLESYQIRMLKEIETYLTEEKKLYITNRSSLIGFIIQKTYYENITKKGEIKSNL